MKCYIWTTQNYVYKHHLVSKEKTPPSPNSSIREQEEMDTNECYKYLRIQEI